MRSMAAVRASTSRKLIEAAKTLREATGRLRFGLPVTHVYNPLQYAWPAHEAYLRTYGAGPKRVIFLGMNPGPFGMAQTGIPFGEIAAVRQWMKIERPVGKPASEHPKRPVLGFACPRSEVSGQRLWGLFAQRHADPAQFFAEHFVVNFCPLAFLEESGRNRTPDKLPPAEAIPLLAACEQHLQSVVDVLKPEWVIAVGDFAETQARRALARRPVKTSKILHPSPASPLANRDWSGAATRRLIELGVWRTSSKNETHPG